MRFVLVLPLLGLPVQWLQASTAEDMEAVWNRAMAHEQQKQTILLSEVHDFVAALKMHAAASGEDDNGISGGINMLHTLVRSSNMVVEEQRRVIAALKDTPNPVLLKYANGMDRVMQLRETPLELSLTVDDKPFDISTWRGKVVLIDFWSTSCSVCIEAMPGIKTVYERYHTQGFEVISVCLDQARNRIKSRDMLGKVGVPWLSAFEPRETSALPSRFGFVFVPVYFLLDREGRLVTTNLYKKEQLEIELQGLLQQVSRDRESVPRNFSH